MQNQETPRYSVKDIIIDEEFRKLIPPLSDEEFEGLKADIIKNGCKIPVTVWPMEKDHKLILVDGHNRYRICTENNIPFKAHAEHYASREAVKIGIINMQLNRRNISPFSRVELALLKEDLIASTNSQGRRTDIFNEPEQNSNRHQNSTNAKIGKIASVSDETVRKIKKIRAEAPEAIREKLRNGEITIEEGYRVAMLPEKIREKVSSEIEGGIDLKSAISETSKISDLGNTEAEGRKTVKETSTVKPSRYYKTALGFAGDSGSLDFDPTNTDITDASLDENIQYPDQFLSSRDFGSHGKIWCDLTRNPSSAPEYARSLCQQLSEPDSEGRFSDVILAVSALTKEDWFQELLSVMSSVCFVRGRQDAIFYHGSDLDRFAEVFSAHGICIDLY